MKKEKIGFLILHYYAIDETINCINSIKEKIDTDNYSIVVVDNNSLNGTGKKLEKKYKEDPNVTIILNKENLGFARGNNIGFKYLKYELNCNYIVMLNNDVLLLSNDISKQLKKEFKENKFAVMGPKIYDKNGKLPYSTSKVDNIKTVKKSIFMNYILLILCFFRLLKIFMKFKNNNINLNDEFNCNDGKRKKNIVLHGCCLIFSPMYIDKFDGIDDRTFLYREEELLYIRLKNNNMISIYNPNIEIKHLEDVATNKSETNFYKKKKNTYKNQINSSKILLKELKNMKRD